MKVPMLLLIFRNRLRLPRIPEAAPIWLTRIWLN